ncbi:MAG: hypothetical protein KDE59_17510, partial [Anaerolineales bacterium]|nr:hypothetical protein [Anaerolineales bacterium]
LAVGSNHVIAVVNVAFEIYDKTGTSVIGPLTFSSFFTGVSGCTGVFDPNALYDEEAGRYILGIDADGANYCVAVSATSDPTGVWYRYAFAAATPSANFFDYPHAGVGDNALYMGGNMFNCAPSCSFIESRIWAYDKAAMYSGNSASFVTASLGTSGFTPQPLNLHGFDQGTWPSTNTHLFMAGLNADNVRLFSWTNALTGGSPGLVTTYNLQTITGVSSSEPLSFPQSGTGGDLQGNDSRPQDFEYRNGYGWVTQAIGCNPGSGTVNCVRWAQINLSSLAVADSGVYGSNGTYRSFPDLAVNHCDDMAVGYTKSSSSMFPGIWVTGRESSDSAGTLQAETQLKAGEITYTAFAGAPHRWGDYTEMTIAPDGLTFWYLGEYSKVTGSSSGRWGTYIGSYTFPSCATQPTATPTTTATSTATPTKTPTSTSTATSTATATNTATATKTPTPTNTPVGPTATNTATATASNTPVGPTATNTATATPSSTPVGPTPTASATPTIIYDNFVYIPLIKH